MKHHPLKSLVTATVLSCLALGGLHAQTAPVKLAGSVTLCAKVTAKKAELEAASGTTFDVIPNTTGKGVVDLVEGRADVALIGGAWEAVVADVNGKAPGKVDTATLNVAPLKPTSLVFITDAANPAKAITTQQAADLLTGKIANWKDVGGADQAVSVILPPPSNGFRIFFQSTLIKGSTYAASAKEIPDLRNIPLVVAQVPGAISFQSTDLPMAAGTRIIPIDKPLAFPLLVVTKKTASPEVGKAVAAIVAAFK
ncbi:phosphate ABC transporter substrate-binding protein, PhoT family [Verrucomicrobium sp. GAS474]|uniref:substrate-binding domain-containing protein n=1 Tax=Verrucomicrobium sp. GAS474 TaxID=1882831 RepID=UPI00087C5E92|nr:substrate-binding domain-containing protein [Verrucomicrobium sp. GAS474]SDU14337.1 phosphate ABC transporter substrate-binding protein, PhoT family [Verrucomicrobium sp. GAS474]